MPVSTGSRYSPTKRLSGVYRASIGRPTVHLCTHSGVTEWGDRSDSCNFTALPARRDDARPLAAAPTRTKAEWQHCRGHSGSILVPMQSAGCALFQFFEIATRACPLLLIQPIDSWRSTQPFKVSHYNGSEVSLARPWKDASQRPWNHKQQLPQVAEQESHYFFNTIIAGCTAQQRA